MIAPIPTVTNILVKKNKNSVTLSRATTRKKFLISKLNASRALVQNGLPWIAHIIYAFLLRNRKNRSKHQKKHLQQQRIHFVTSLSHFLSFSSMYSRITRITRQIVITSDPNATVPKWYLEDELNYLVLLPVAYKKSWKSHSFYLTDLPRPTVNVKYGTSFLWNVQYHVANVAAKTISPRADTKNTPQKKPNTLNAYNIIEFFAIYFSCWLNII